MKSFTLLSCVLVLGALASALPQDIFGYLKEKSNEVVSEEHGVGTGAKPTNCSCGWTNKARIVGGRETLRNEFPLIAGIVNVKIRRIFCGGTIVTPYHVLTAAHCTEPMKDEKLAVIVGEHDVTNADDTDIQVILVDRMIDHEDYNPRNFFNDISLLVLKKMIEFTQFVGPACLPTGPKDMVKESVKVLGWGRLKNKGDTSNVLMKVNLRVLPITTCANTYIREIRTSNPFQLCTFGTKKDSCQGDSGGPVLWLDPSTNRFTLAGIVSYGKACASKSPALNTDVSFFLPWIQEKIASTNHGVQTCSRVD